MPDRPPPDPDPDDHEPDDRAGDDVGGGDVGGGDAGDGDGDVSNPDGDVPDDDPDGASGDDIDDDSFGDLPGLGDALGDDFGFGPDDPLPLDDHESAMVQQDLTDLEAFERTFRAEGYRGVSVYCRDCEVEHYYPWELLRENLRLLLETGETPVHEPAFDPDPAHYVPWEYARGYVDALHDAGVPARIQLDDCPTCGYQLGDELGGANFCPRCSTPLIGPRLIAALQGRGMDADTLQAVLHEVGIPGRH